MSSGRRSDVDPFRPTPIFDEVGRWARDASAGTSMLTFSPAGAATPGTARTVLALLTAAREEAAPRHALRRP